MLKWIIITGLAYLLFRMIYKSFFRVPRDFKRYADNMKGYRKDGNVKTDNKPGNKPRFDKDDGEEIDYEDVND